MNQNFNRHLFPQTPHVRQWITGLLIFSSFALNAAAQTSTPSNSGTPGVAAVSAAPNLLQYDKPDRAEKILEAANKEGTLTFYTAFRPQDLPLIIAPFEARG